MSTLVSANTEVLTTEACWRLLDDSPVGRLAVVRGGEPDIFPVNYVVDHGGILPGASQAAGFSTTLMQPSRFSLNIS